MKRLLRAERDLRYGTRRLKAGEYFEASGQHAKVLTALKRASLVPGNRMPAAIPPMPEDLKTRVPKPAAVPVMPADPYQPARAVDDEERSGAPAAEAVDERPELRAAYERVVGRRPYMGWDADTLREKIAEAGT